ncbi:MAG: histidine phosphatase family protein [Acidobacteriota bacterium]|nr:histidine phosphatase family protein [Acidobacteriota bacterium]
MLVYLVRHGIAVSRNDPTSPADAARPLTPKGIEKTMEVARGIAELRAHPTVMISSPLLRAVQTGEIFAEVLGFPVTRLRRSENLAPEAKPAALFAELARLKAKEVMCFGHAPHLDETIAAAVGKGPAFTQLKKAGVALLEFDSFEPPKALLCWLYTPKALRKLGG